MRTSSFGRRLVGMGLLVLFALAAGMHWLMADEPLEPWVQDWLAAAVPGPADNDNGYLLLLGMGAPEGEDPVAWAQAWLAAPRQPGGNGPVEAPGEDAGGGLDLHSLPRPGNGLLCRPGEPLCFEAISAPVAQRGELLTRHAVLLARYRRLLTYQRLSTVSAAGAAEEPAPFQYLPVAAQLLRLQVMEQILQGRRGEAAALLREDVAGLRRHLALADQLVYKMVLVRLLSDQLVFLHRLGEEGLLRMNASLWAALLAPLSAAERDLTPAMQHELAQQAALLRSLDRDPRFFDETRPLPGWVVRAMFKPNMSINATALPLHHVAELSLLDAAAFAARADEATPASRGGRLRNRAGYALVEVARPDFRPYIQRLHGLDAELERLRAVN